MTEHEIAVMEAEMIRANDEYFSARPELNTPQARKVYDDAFKRAWLFKQEKKIVRRGSIFTLEDYGTVKFEGLDFYHGECTARLMKLGPGIFQEKLDRKTLGTNLALAKEVLA